MRLLVALLLGAASVGRALAQDPDLDALAVADNALPAAAPPVHDWRVFVEAALDWAGYRQGPDQEAGEDLAQNAERLSFDVHYDPLLAPGLHAVLADRLDVDRQEPVGTTEINTLKEAYLSWQESPDRLLDLGRINVRDGVAMGYNPTDYFRIDAVRSIVSINPASLRENRLGSAMLRVQQLWDGGSLTALASPELQEQPSSAPFSADFGATNSRNRWLVGLSERLGADFDPQLLLFGSEHQPVQAGVNLTHLVGSATVVFAEWSGGRSATLAQQADGVSEPTAFLSRLATGFTYTAPFNLAVTVEYERNEAAPDRDEWTALELAGLPQLTRVVQFISQSQDLPDRQALFALAVWTDAVVRHLDLSAFTRIDLKDESHLSWAEARYHWSRLDLALQWQFAGGSPETLYGAYSPRELGQLLVDWYMP
jgi:hypothetical protein